MGAHPGGGFQFARRGDRRGCFFARCGGVRGVGGEREACGGYARGLGALKVGAREGIRGGDGGAQGAQGGKRADASGSQREPPLQPGDHERGRVGQRERHELAGPVAEHLAEHEVWRGEDKLAGDCEEGAEVAQA